MDKSPPVAQDETERASSWINLLRMHKDGFLINPLVSTLDAPPIPEAQSWRAEYDGRFGPMIDLSQAVPGHSPPDAFLDRLATATHDAETARYGPILGDLALRDAHATDCRARYQAEITVDNVAITAGCNMAFVVAMLAIARAGDSIALPAPWYFNHKMALDMLGIRTIALPCRASHGFVPDPAEAEEHLASDTRAIVLVTPNNPTGAIYPAEVIESFVEICRRRRIALVLDETYRDFLDQPPHRAFSAGNWGETVVQLYSFSKAYAIPGHRLGAMLAAPDVVREIAKILDTVQICPARPAQRVTAWAIEALRPWRQSIADALQLRASACREAFAQLPGWSLDSLGAYFAYAAHPFVDLDARSAAHKLAVEAGILALPGTYFGPGQKTHLRFAMANVPAETLDTLPARFRQIAMGR